MIPTTHRIPVAVEAFGTVSDARSHAEKHSDRIRIRASDLREAQRRTHRLRLDEAGSGRDPRELTVLVDIEVIIAPVARDARTQSLLAGCLPPPDSPATIRYVGTPEGLATLITDIHAANVADGATLIPVDGHGSTRLIIERVLPLLDRRPVLYA